MQQTTKEIGNRGEQIAREILTGKGYAIVGSNMVIGRVEVDIVAMNERRLLIVEVKTRRADHLDDNFGIDREKLRRLSRAGDTYVRMMNLPHEVQLDAILITNNPDGSFACEHLEDIALPPTRFRR